MAGTDNGGLLHCDRTLAVDILLLVKAAIMGIVEGLTEFLPISSTGHLILAGSLLGFDDAKAKVFDIAIQTGAIFAVVLVYWQKIRTTLVELPSSRQAQKFALNVIIGFLPAVVLALIFGKFIKAHLFTPTVVATTFILGGFVILWAERRPASAMRVQTVDEMTPLDALKVGLVFSFISAWLCVRWLLRYISTNSFVPFAWYRIAFGIIVLVTAFTGVVSWSEA
jgi:undecaprenyl pyrophosphate phosphatase UppP